MSTETPIGIYTRASDKIVADLEHSDTGRPRFESYPPALGADRRSSRRHHESRRLRAAPAGVS